MPEITDRVVDLGHEWLVRGQEPVRAVSRGELALTSAIPGIDFATRQAPTDAESQFELAYENLDRVLADSGLSRDNIAMLDVTIPGREYRKLIEPGWLDRFPDARIRPARKTNQRPLPKGLTVQLHAVCMSGKRSSLEIAGLEHRAPIPMGSQIGDHVFSSVIGGDDPQSGELERDPAAQIDLAMANCARLMEAAGGDAGGINHMWVFLADWAHSSIMLDAYLRQFPLEMTRPARKTIPYDLPEGCMIQIQMTGSVRGRRAIFEVPDFRHHDPIPLASRAGGLLQSSGIHGLQPHTLSLVEGGIAPQTDSMVRTIEGLMDQAGATKANIVGLALLVEEFSDAPLIWEQVIARWGDAPLPAIRFARVPLPPGMKVQAHVTAWLD